MLKVGLTGSIAVGKSFVLGVLEDLGCHVLNADVTAREVVAPGTEGLMKVVAAFGPEVLAADGSLDRGHLATIIFKDKAKRLRLNAILHPLIMAAQDRQITQWEDHDPGGIAVVDAALMIESGGYKRFDKLIVVHCRPELQLERLMSRNALTRENAQRRIAAQMSQEEKKRYAHFLVDTSDSFDMTRQRTEEVYAALRSAC